LDLPERDEQLPVFNMRMFDSFSLFILMPKLSG
jgi:hypothetical protein